MTEEMKKAQAAVRSFRVTDDVMVRFKELQEEMNLTQDGALKMLVDAYELEKAKNAIPDRETEIANFQTKASELIEAFLHSLQLNSDAEARIRNEFALKLDGQAQTIADYQTQVAELKKQLEEATNLAEAFQTDLTAVQGSVAEEAEKRGRAEAELAALKEEKEKQLADKSSIIDMLTSKLADAEQKASEYDALRARTEALERDLAEALQTIKDNAKDAEIAQERAVRAAEKALETEHKKEIDRLRSQNTELLQTISANEREASEQIRELEREKSALREELAALKAQGKHKE